jgi:hypothetical protein
MVFSPGDENRPSRPLLLSGEAFAWQAYATDDPPPLPPPCAGNW